MKGWQARAKVGVSRAEDQIHAELQARGLTRGMIRNEAVILGEGILHQYDFCIPDFKWKVLKLAVFIDGAEAHKSDGSKRRDESKTEKLQALGWTVRRYGYKGKLAHFRKLEICNSIALEIKMLGYKEATQ